MKIIQIGINKYIDQELFDHINFIWASYDKEISGDSNVFFAKNTTVNRLITDYAQKKISRVIKREKADYVIINRFELNNYPQFYDGKNLTDDDSKEVIYSAYNFSMEIQDTIELILDFHNRGQKVEYINQDKLNDSLNNGFIVDEESYSTLKELIDSNNADNHKLAVSMLIQSDLKANWQWIIYLFHKKYGFIQSYDQKKIIANYFDTLGLGNPLLNITNSLDISLGIVTNKNIQDRFIYMVKERFQNGIQSYLKTLGTDKFKLNDFKIEYNA